MSESTPAPDSTTKPPATPAGAAVRPSGLRPPSKIGRICAAGPPKPAIPPSPKANGSSTDVARKYSDDYSRKHLADVQEADEDSSEIGAIQRMGSHGERTPSRERKPSTCSTYSVTSMDALWEHHPRRMSEAGLRRTSDHSVVLTEDTDSFIIGDRVWVGGSKPGQIAYIGDTQFAPGEWAGVVLDEAIGKNDGSVAGVRYFQCESRRGVFSRLTRLTHEPLDLPSPSSPGSELGSCSASNGGSRPASGLRAPSSPAPRAPGMPATPASPAQRVTPTRAKRSVSPNGSMRSFSSRISTSTVSAELRLGERVIVSSSQGSKAGTLRYVGPADFASGQWCGVELDDPIGKNDGSVEGKRYFDCGPRFGLFAPLSKVSRSPSNRRPGSCAVHGSRATSPPESNASMTSMQSSVVMGRPRLGVTSLAGGAQRLSSGPRVTSTPMSAKNTLQEILREKQQHIEKLIKEHEVERGEQAKMGLQMDRTQTALASSQKENAQYLKDIEKLKVEYEVLSRQLDDEKQKVEDLMFRAEEDNIHKEDFGRFKEELMKEKEKLAATLQGLESELEQTKHQVDELQAQCVLMEGQHRAENEILLAQHKDEVQAGHALAAQLQNLLDEAHSLLREKDGDKESLGKNHYEELTKLKIESEKTINELKSKLTELQLESSEQIKLLTDNLTEATTKLSVQNEKLEKMSIEHSNVVSDLRSQLEQKHLALDLKLQEHNQVIASAKESELLFKKDIEKLKMETSAKNLDNETLGENNQQLEAQLKKLQIEFDKMKVDLVSKDSELEEFSSNTSKQQETIQDEIKQLKNAVTQKETEISQVTAHAQETQQTYQKQLEDQSNKLTSYTEEITNLKSQIELLNLENTKQTGLLQEDLKKKLDEQDSQVKSVNKQLEDKNQLLEESVKKCDVLNSEKEEQTHEIKKLTDLITQKQAKVDELVNNVTEITTTLSALQLENGDLTRQLRNETEKNIEIQQQKEKLAGEISNLSNHSTTSDEQINSLMDKLREAEKDIQSVKEANREKVNNLERVEQELKQQLEQVKSQTEKDKFDLTEQLNDKEISVKESENQVQTLNAKLIEIQEKSSVLLSDLEAKYQVIISELTTAVETKNNSETKLKKQVEDLELESSKIISDLKKRLDILQENGHTSEGQLKEKLNELVAVQNELNQKLEASQKHELELQGAHSKLKDMFDATKQSLEAQLKVKEEKENVLELEVKKLHEEKETSGSNLNEKDSLIKELQHKVSMYELDLKSNLDIVSEKERQINTNSEDIQKLLDEKHELEKKLNLNLSECETNVQKINNLLEDNSSKDGKLKEQESAINKLKEHMDSIISEKKSIEHETVQTSESLNHFKLTNETLVNQIQKLETTMSQLHTEISSKSDKIVFLESEINKFKDIHTTVENLKTDINKHINEIENKNIVISQLNENVKSLKKDSADEFAEKDQRHKSLESEIAEIKTNHLHELSELKKIIHNMENEKAESQKKIERLDDANSKISEFKTQLEKSETDIQKLTSLNEAQKKNYEQLNNQLKEDFEKLKSDGKKDRKQLKEQLKEQLKVYDSQAKENDKQLKLEQEQKSDLLSKFEEATNTVKELQNKIQYLEASSEKKSGDEKTELQKVVLELQNCQKAHDEEYKALKSEISGLQEQLTKKNSDSTKYSNHIATLENDLKKYKTHNEGLLLEVTCLTKEMNESKKFVKPDLNSNTNNVPKIEIRPVDVDAKRLLEEKEEVEGQVNFLNSVIVDMQKKNEELKARVEVLEMGCTAQEADEYNYNGLKARALAPRMFCDICDVFDAHETEDCPRQTSEADTLPPQPDKRKATPAPRLYCEICERFGHATEDCDDEETY